MGILATLSFLLVGALKAAWARTVIPLGLGILTPGVLKLTETLRPVLPLVNPPYPAYLSIWFLRTSILFWVSSTLSGWESWLYLSRRVVTALICFSAEEYQLWMSPFSLWIVISSWFWESETSKSYLYLGLDLGSPFSSLKW